MCETTSRHVSPTTPISLIVRRDAVCWSAYKRVARKIRCTGLCGDLAAALLVLCAVPAIALAQQPNGADNAGSQPTHDGAPTQIAPPSSNQQAPDAQGAATVVGTVHDASGASVSGAEVRLIRGDGKPSQTTASGANGEFSFIRIVGGSYRVTVNDVSFAPFTSAEFTLTLQQMYEVPDVSLTLATKNTEVTVHPAEFVAAEQIRAAEKQRLLGVIPNFYTSYIYDAAPLTVKQKFLFAVRGTFDPVAMVGVGFGAGIEQATNAFPGYGQGASGYAKRYAAKFTDGRTSDFLTHAIFPSLLHQDPRYFYQGAGSFKSRLAHAVGSAFFTRNDGGFTQPNYSYLLGDFSSAALSNLYYPRANRGAGLVFTNAAVGLAGRIGGNVLREFSKRVTTNVPAERKP